MTDRISSILATLWVSYWIALNIGGDWMRAVEAGVWVVIWVSRFRGRGGDVSIYKDKMVSWPYCYTPDESRSYYCMALVVCLSVRPPVNIWLCTRVTTCRISFNFADIIHLVCPIHDTGNGPWSSLIMRILTQLPISNFGHSWGHFSS